MYRIEARYLGSESASLTLTLPFEKRQKSRFRAVLDDGSEVALALERGQPLRHQERLVTTCGRVVEVRAEPEPLSVASAKDPRLLCKAAYHLGNRHVPVAIAPSHLAYHADHVLDEMVAHLGLAITQETLPFEPESGAYGTGHAHLGGGPGTAAGKIHI